VAGVLAAAARLGADAAVLVVAGVMLTLGVTGTTHFCACAYLGAEDREIQLGLAGDDLGRHATNGGTVQTESNAFHELSDHRLSEARIRA
jgi:hypothetical protein